MSNSKPQKPHNALNRSKSTSAARENSKRSSKQNSHRQNSKQPQNNTQCQNHYKKPVSQAVLPDQVDDVSQYPDSKSHQHQSKQQSHIPFVMSEEDLNTTHDSFSLTDLELLKLRDENKVLLQKNKQLSKLLNELNTRVISIERSFFINNPNERTTNVHKGNVFKSQHLEFWETPTENFQKDLNKRILDLENKIQGYENLKGKEHASWCKPSTLSPFETDIDDDDVPEFLVKTGFERLTSESRTAVMFVEGETEAVRLNYHFHANEFDNERPRFNLSVDTKWHFDTRIGTGAFGDVWVASKRSNERTVSENHYESGSRKKDFGSRVKGLEKVVIKRITKDSIGQRWENPANEGLEPVGVALPTEAMLMAKAGGHPNIMPLIETYEDSTSFFFVMPCLPKHPRDVERFIQEYTSRSQRIPENVIRRIFFQILRALAYLHVDRRIAHRDIKPSNIIVNDDLDVNIIDLGLAHRIRIDDFTGEELCETVPNGTPVYTPGEVHVRIPYKASKTDIWAAGCVLYELVEGVRLFNTSEEVQKVRDRNSLFSQLFSRRRGPSWPRGLDKLAEKLLDPNPLMRPDAVDLLSDP
ncbi:Sperm motility kinase 2A, partial [Nowakowskiella sp. JEL0078]